MALESEFTVITLESLHNECAALVNDGWRFIQTHCVNTENDGVDIY